MPKSQCNSSAVAKQLAFRRIISERLWSSGRRRAALDATAICGERLYLRSTLGSNQDWKGRGVEFVEKGDRDDERNRKRMREKM
jgi:predicted secreted protein